MGAGGRNSTAAFVPWLSRRALRIHVTGTSPCLTCVPGERSLLCSLPGFWGSSSFSRRRGWDQGAGRWEASLVEGVRGLRAGVGCAVSVAGARRVGSEAFSASWSLQDLPLKWEGGFILSEGGSHCWYNTDSPERPCQVKQAPTPSGAKDETARGVSNVVSLECNVTCVMCGKETSGQNMRSGIVRQGKGSQKTCLRPSYVQLIRLLLDSGPCVTLVTWVV